MRTCTSSRTRSAGPVHCDRGLTVIPTETPATLPDPDLIVVPGSDKPVTVMSEQVLIDRLRAAASRVQVDRFGLHRRRSLRRRCSRARPPQTHSTFRDNLHAMGIEAVADRVVWHGIHLSGAGVSAGLDIALSLS
jgi:hypothetical protein